MLLFKWYCVAKVGSFGALYGNYSTAKSKAKGPVTASGQSHDVIAFAILSKVETLIGNGHLLILTFLFIPSFSQHATQHSS